MTINAPAHLSERSRELWSEVVAEKAATAGRRAQLLVGLEALDRAGQARERLNAEGLTTTTKSTGTIHVHPLVKVEKEAHAQFLLVCQTLGLGWERSGGDKLLDAWTAIAGEPD